MERKEPLSEADAKKEILRLLKEGSLVIIEKHMRRAQAADVITHAEILSVLRGGFVEPAEFENGQWRYRVTTGARTMYVVVTFVGEELRVVTTWRKKR